MYNIGARLPIILETPKMLQTKLHLNRKDRLLLQSFRTKGLHRAREINRAHILAALDRDIPESQIMAMLGVGRTALWRTRAAYLKGGLEFALHDEARPGQPRHFDTNAEAKVAALACSEPPQGAKRWTLDLLTRAMRKQAEIRSISRDTIRLMLKKTASNRG